MVFVGDLGGGGKAVPVGGGANDAPGCAAGYVLVGVAGDVDVGEAGA